MPQTRKVDNHSSPSRRWSKISGRCLRTTLDFNSSGSTEEVMDDDDDEESSANSSIIMMLDEGSSHKKTVSNVPSNSKQDDSCSLLRMTLDLCNDSAIVSDFHDDEDDDDEELNDIIAREFCTPRSPKQTNIYAKNCSPPCRWKRTVNTTGGRLTKTVTSAYGSPIPYHPDLELAAVVDFHNSSNSRVNKPQRINKVNKRQYSTMNLNRNQNNLNSNLNDSTRNMDEVTEDFSPRSHKKISVRLSDKLACPSPPHRRLHALRLFDTPHTPQTLLLNVGKDPRSPSDRETRRYMTGSKRTKKAEPRLEANVNPFATATSTCISGEKRTRSQSERYSDLLNLVEEIDCPQPKKIGLAGN